MSNQCDEGKQAKFQDADATHQVNQDKIEWTMADLCRYIAGTQRNDRGDCYDPAKHEHTQTAKAWQRCHYFAEDCLDGEEQEDRRNQVRSPNIPRRTKGSFCLRR